MNIGLITSLLCLGLFQWAIHRSDFFSGKTISKKWFHAAWLLKLMASVALFAVYTYHYSDRTTADIHKYFHDAQVVYSLIEYNPALFFDFMMGNNLSSSEAQAVMNDLHGWTHAYTYGLNYDVPAFVRLHVLLLFISQGACSFHVIFMCMLSFVGSMGIFKLFDRYVDSRLAWIIVFATPSLIFWSSGILKEAPLVAALGLFLFAFSKWWYNEWHNVYFIPLLFGLCGLIIFKNYVFLAFIPAFFFLLLQKKKNEAHFKKVLVIIGLGAVSTFALHYFDYYHSPAYILQKKQQDFYNVAQAYNSGSTIQAPSIDQPWKIFSRSLHANLNTWFRPLPGETNSVVMFPAMIENTFLFILLTVMVLNFSRRESIVRTWQWALLLYVTTLGIIIGFTVPVMGAIVRYKIVGLPFLLFVIVVSIRPRQAWLLMLVGFFNKDRNNTK